MPDCYSSTWRILELGEDMHHKLPTKKCFKTLNLLQLKISTAKGQRYKVLFVSFLRLHKKELFGKLIKWRLKEQRCTLIEANEAGSRGKFCRAANFSKMQIIMQS